MPTEVLKLILITIVVLFLLKIGVNLGINLLINSLLLSFLFNFRIQQIFKIWKDVAISPETCGLIGIVLLVYLLSIVLERLKNFEGIVSSLQDLINDYRLVMILITSFVALLPIQGGAIFSAPMIKSIGQINQVNSEKNMFINYWFRHIWNLIWPLYPNFIIYSSLVDISIVSLVVLILPFAIVSFLTGTIWVYMNLKYNPVQEKVNNQNILLKIKIFTKNSWPILVVILLTLFCNVNLLISLFIVLTAMFIFCLKLRKHFFQLILESIARSHKTVLMIFGIFIFKAVLEHSQVINSLPEYFLFLGIPVDGVLVIVPFLVGILTGSMTAIVGICVPVFIVFLKDINGLILNRIVILYVAGYIGMMCTPIHLCLAITKDYFNIKTIKFYSILIKNLSILGFFTLAYYIILS
jgi:hypothetical protein